MSTQAPEEANSMEGAGAHHLEDPRPGPSMAMKLTILGISKKFQNVQNIDTGTLHQSIQRECGSSVGTASDTTAGGRGCGTSAQPCVVVVDTRAEEEYAVSHIEGAIRADHGTTDLENLLEKIDGKCNGSSDRRVVCYCSVGYRSSVLAERLSQAFQQKSDESAKTEVYNLEGSIFKWANERRPMVDGQGEPTVYAHPYNIVFGKLLNKDYRK